MTPADVLEQGADYIEENGWWNGSDNEGGDCAVTAMAMVASPHKSVGALNSAIRALAARVGCQVSKWNDAHDEITVVETMRKVAAELRWDEVDA